MMKIWFCWKHPIWEDILKFSVELCWFYACERLPGMPQEDTNSSPWWPNHFLGGHTHFLFNIISEMGYDSPAKKIWTDMRQRIHWWKSLHGREIFQWTTLQKMENRADNMLLHIRTITEFYEIVKFIFVYHPINFIHPSLTIFCTKSIIPLSQMIISPHAHNLEHGRKSWHGKLYYSSTKTS